MKWAIVTNIHYQNENLEEWKYYKIKNNPPITGDKFREIPQMFSYTILSSRFSP